MIAELDTVERFPVPGTPLESQPGTERPQAETPSGCSQFPAGISSWANSRQAAGTRNREW